MITLEAFRNHVLDNMQDLELVIQDVLVEHVKGKLGYALFDGGAHKGFHTLRMLGLAGCARVYAIEADPFMAEVLRGNLEKKPVKEGTKLIVIQKALLGDPSVTHISWKSSISHVGRSSIVTTDQQRATIWEDRPDIVYRDMMQVEATTIDTILAVDPGPVPFLKLDLEGADLVSLRGGHETLTRHRPLVAFENSVHAPKVHGFTIEEMAAYFESFDYVPMNFVGEALTPATWFGLFEAMAAPREHADWLSRTLQTAVGNRLRS